MRELEDLYREALEIVQGEIKANGLRDTRYVRAVIGRVLNDAEDPNTVCRDCCGLNGQNAECIKCREYLSVETGDRQDHARRE
jgi:hypothetical protein